MGMFDPAGLLAVFFPEVGWSRMREFFQASSGDPAGMVILGLLMVAVPLAILGTLAGLALGLWPPRPRWRRRLARPGVVACLASAASWPIAGAFMAGYHHVLRETPWGGWRAWDFDAYALATFGGFAVAAAWATLALNRRWRGEPNWPDRVGRLVGSAWVVMFVLACYFLLWRPG
jgi:hypothetical protein